MPLDLVEQTRALKRLPVVTFAAGGLATPADVSLLMQLGCDGVFVGSGIFKASVLILCSSLALTLSESSRVRILPSGLVLWWRRAAITSMPS